MHHPLKHVLVKNNKAVLIDFERTHATEKPQNVTQFCQYVSGVKVLKLLQEKGFKFTKTQITMAAKRYKKDINEKNFKEIINALK
jgi:predicted Ser/Thr protein kinase